MQKSGVVPELTLQRGEQHVRQSQVALMDTHLSQECTTYPTGMYASQPSVRCGQCFESKLSSIVKSF